MPQKIMLVEDEAIHMANQLHSLHQEKKAKEEQLELAMDAEDHGYWDWNIDTNETYFSPRYYKMLGYEPGELPMCLSTWEKLLHPEDKEKVIAGIMDKVKKAEPFEFEFRLQAKDGGWKWIRGKGKSYEVDEKGKPHRAVGTHENITEEKLAKIKLNEESTLLRQIAETSPIGITKVDKEGTVIYANRTAEAILGLEKSKILERTYNDVKWEIKDINGDDFPIEELPFSKVKRTENPVYDVQHSIVWSAGERKLLSINAAPLYDKDGSFDGMVAIISDITDLSDIKSQIDAIQIVHEKLFQTGKVDYVKVDDYLLDLVNSIVKTFSPHDIEVKKDLDSIYFPTKKVVTLGLIVNEITTNAIKHGFEDGEKKAVFSIFFKKENNTTCTLTLSNNGRPFPEDIDINNPDSLGLRLISSLTHQIDGRVELQKKPHPEFLITVPMEEGSF